jgi:hypothetical protein
MARSTDVRYCGNTNENDIRTSLIVRRWVMDTPLAFEAFSTTRAGLVQLTHFVRTLEQQVGAMRVGHTIRL